MVYSLRPCFWIGRTGEEVELSGIIPRRGAAVPSNSRLSVIPARRIIARSGYTACRTTPGVISWLTANGASGSLSTRIKAKPSVPATTTPVKTKFRLLIGMRSIFAPDNALGATPNNCAISNGCQLETGAAWTCPVSGIICGAEGVNNNQVHFATPETSSNDAAIFTAIGNHGLLKSC